MEERILEIRYNLLQQAIQIAATKGAGIPTEKNIKEVFEFLVNLMDGRLPVEEKKK